MTEEETSISSYDRPKWQLTDKLLSATRGNLEQGGNKNLDVSSFCTSMPRVPSPPSCASLTSVNWLQLQQRNHTFNPVCTHSFHITHAKIHLHVYVHTHVSPPKFFSSQVRSNRYNFITWAFYYFVRSAKHVPHSSHNNVRTCKYSLGTTNFSQVFQTVLCSISDVTPEKHAKKKRNPSKPLDTFLYIEYG